MSIKTTIQPKKVDENAIFVKLLREHPKEDKSNEEDWNEKGTIMDVDWLVACRTGISKKLLMLRRTSALKTLVLMFKVRH